MARLADVAVIHSPHRVGGIAVRGSDEKTGALFSYVDLETRVRPDHPLRAIRLLTNEALAALQGDFSALNSGMLERLLRAMLLQAFYSIRSERQLTERLDFDLLFPWFVGLGVDDTRVGPLHLLQEPRPPAGGRGGCALSLCAARPAPGEAAPVQRALQRRRDPDRGLGVDEEPQAQGWRRITATRAIGAIGAAVLPRRTLPAMSASSKNFRRE